MWVVEGRGWAVGYPRGGRGLALGTWQWQWGGLSSRPETSAASEAASGVARSGGSGKAGEPKPYNWSPDPGSWQGF